MVPYREVVCTLRFSDEPDPLMTRVIAILAIAFAAFCIWMTVRIINRRERWAMWLAVIFGVLIYVEVLIICFGGGPRSTPRDTPLYIE